MSVSLESLEERARRVLCKGIRKKRFRRLRTWTIKNRILGGILWAMDWKVSDFAEAIGVSPRSVDAWIYEGRVPSEENQKKAEKLLKCPRDILFREARRG